jgi:hypothetical protein
LRHRRRASAAVIVALVLLAATGPAAQAKSFFLPRADVQVAVQSDGSLAVAERITFSYSGAFRGANRDIPVRSGESIEGMAVSEQGRPYTLGAPTEIGSSGTPGTYGVDTNPERVRVVWHYSALNEQRTYEIS